MAFFVTEDMKLCQMILHIESAFNCLIVLGYEGKVQFRNIFDGNPTLNNQFTSEITRCQELQRIISYLQQAINESNIEIVVYPDVDEDEIPEANDLKTMETAVQQIYDDLVQETSNMDALRKKHVHVSEQLQVLEKADEFLGVNGQRGQAVMAWSNSVIKMSIINDVLAYSHEEIYLSFFTGTIPVERFQAFEIMLWRVTKGYFYMKHDEYLSMAHVNKNIYSQELSRKYVFMIFFLGPELHRKISKLCQAFGVQLFTCSESQQERQVAKAVLKKEISDLDLVLERSEEHRYHLLLGVSSDLYIWRAKLNKMCLVYYVLNRMGRVRHLHMNKYLRAECWIADREISAVRSALVFGARRTAKGDLNSMFLPLVNEIRRRHLNELDKPTYFVLNRFTKAFQNLIDSYGVAKYQELNPAPYTIVTFPFLFAVMFGDMGHGLIMFLFGIWMVLKEKVLAEKQRFAREQSEIFNILFAGRYIITLMGAFSIYTGLIYNDCFSKGLNIFGSSWRVDFSRTTVYNSPELQLDPNNPKHYSGTPYILGMDPVWKASGESAITTFNSLKMKLSIILGVAHMVFGLMLSAINYVRRKQYVNLLVMFLPQMTFMLCLFMYLVFLIFYKWIEFGGHIQTPYNSACAPSILITFINMLMMKEAEQPPAGCETWMYEMQPEYQMALMTAALLSIPLLFAGKPLYLMLLQRRVQKIKNEQLKDFARRTTVRFIRQSLLYNVESSLNAIESEDSKKEKPDGATALSDLWIHSGIHCMESVLGAVSHTASYLRLWALSLAHEQLSTVLWNMVLRVGLTGTRGYWNSLVLSVMFIFWSITTVAILVVMEGMSAFLHTLRLHWVEFQSKFYDGSGEPFQPFRFAVSSPNKIY